MTDLLPARPFIGVDRALGIVSAVISQEEAACAVVGPMGELLAFAADDRVGALPRRLAVRKAYSAVMFRRSTALVAASVADGALDVASLGDEMLFSGIGGVPIVIDGIVVGGVSDGAAPECVVDKDQSAVADQGMAALVVGQKIFLVGVDVSEPK